LTGCRFFAALAVLAVHFSYPAAQSMPHWIGRSGIARAAVSFFFVLSGFILAYCYLDVFAQGIRRASVSAYARARFARVYPIHLLTLVTATAGLVWLRYHNSPIAAAGPGASSVQKVGAAWVANLLLLQAWSPDRLIQNQFNAPSWSVACEAFFYLTFPLIAAWVLPRLKSHLSLVLAAVLAWVVGWIASEVCRAFVLEQTGERLVASMVAIRNPLLRLPEFFIGCCCGAFFLKTRGDFRSQGVRNAVLALAMAVVLSLLSISALGMDFGRAITKSPMPYVPAFAAILWCLADGRTFLSPLLAAPVIVLLGEASYSLYMIHWLPVVILRDLTDDGRVEGYGWITLATALGCVLASIAFFKWFEAPARHFLRKRKTPDNADRHARLGSA
jgi:peptidoglycan/LPS O-acetylase OafA/YrhL